MLPIRRLRRGRISNRLAVFAAVLLGVTGLINQEPAGNAQWASTGQPTAITPDAPASNSAAGGDEAQSRRTGALTMGNPISSLIFRF